MESNIKHRLPNPRDGANIFSRITFGYTFKTFLQGYRKDFEEDDLTDVLATHKSSNIGDKMEKTWEIERLQHTQTSLWRALCRMFGLELITYGFVMLVCECVIKLAQPLVLAELITYYSQSKNVERNSRDAYLYSGLIVGLCLLNISVIHHNMLNLQILAMKARIAVCSLIYRKSLRLSRTALHDTAAGQIANFLSNDVSRFDTYLVILNTLWVCPAQLVVAACVLYVLLGISATVGVILLVLCVPTQAYLGKISSKFRLKTALRTDDRVRLMTEIVSGIQVIKMYTWEKPFSKLVDAVRRIEVGHIRSASYIKGVLVSFLYFPRLAIFLSILTYVLTGSTPDAKYVFVIASFYNNLRHTVNMQFPRAISGFAELLISIQRFQKFLLMDEVNVNDKLKPDIITFQMHVPIESGSIELRNASASWFGSSEETFSNINFRAAKDQLVAVIGPVGGGKTSILQAILKELPLSNGEVSVLGTISYASQEPWLFSASIKQNILFGQKMDPLRYAEVLKVCALEQDLEFLPYGDLSLVGDRGITLSGGQKARIALARAVYANADIYLLDDPLSAVDPHVGRQLFDDCIHGYLHNKCRVLVTHQTQFLQNADKIYLVEGGKIVISGTYTEIKESGVHFSKHLQASEMAEGRQPMVTISAKDTKVEGLPVQIKEQKLSGGVSSSIYREYLKAGDSKLNIFIVMVLLISTFCMNTFIEYFLTFWVNQEQIRATSNGQDTSDLLSTSTSIYIYSGAITLLMLIAYTTIYFFFRFCMKSSVNLHNKMFLSIVYAPLRFFNINPSGRILNRFSKDIGTVDELLPAIAIECINITLTTISVVVLICIVNPWLLLATAVIFSIFYCLTRIYLATSRSVKRLEGITRSPVFTHITASLRGLTTIRAFKVQNLLQEEFDRHQDLHTSSWFSFLICSRAFGYYLDIFSTIYIAIVTFSFFISPTEFGGNVGLAITQAINLTGMFQWGTRQWSELQNYMTSVERVVEYTQIEPEDKRKEQHLSQAWPENGKISFASLSLRYSPSDSYVLNQLTFTAEAKEKIGVVGRTGAGKSSLIAALFQLTDTEGSIFIDGIDITQVPFNSFRSKMSIIPQEPVLFSGSLRKNLDPFNLYGDAVLWKALDDVELKTVVAEMPLGLLASVTEGGSNFSVGQRQLLCLARAIIRNNNILILDEATANVDPQTDTIIQKTIRDQFSNCTVLTIAHRLHTIIDSDKILVLDAGKIVEFDHPHVLLQNKKGRFYSMVQQTGQGSAEALIEIAAMNYKKKKTE